MEEDGWKKSRDELPRRGKWVEINTVYGRGLAKRGWFWSDWWITVGGLKEIISMYDYWRDIRKDR